MIRFVNQSKKVFPITCILLILLCTAEILTAQQLNIKNDQFWNTSDGSALYSQGGGIFQFADPQTNEVKYYWYGAFYKEAELYRNDPSITQPIDNFVAVTCYSSTDLVNWKFENNVLDRKEVDKHYKDTRWMGRLGVLYLKGLYKYVMFIQHDKEVLVTVADNPTGPFEWHRRINMESRIGTSNTGDQTIFTDDDGTSYLVYSYGRGRHIIYISEIGVKDGQVDLLDCTPIFKGKGREGNCMFKYKGKYYVFASNLYGWDSSYAYYLVADDIRGPYTPENKMLITPGCQEDYAHVTQTGFFVNVKGSKQETVVYCGDRWANFAGNGLGYNQWCPLSFVGETPYFNSLHSWNLDEATGEWQVADDNNYVRNGSFEADRRHIPSPEKPLQEQLKGWTTKIYQGNEIVIGDLDSPVLNYFNTEADRKFVTGEKSLNISDNVQFERKVYQSIESTPFAKLADGDYALTAKIKNSANFQLLEVYAESGGRKKSLEIKQNDSWTQIELDGIEIVNGKVEIGFIARGLANASCQIDDVTLVKSR
ncbi:family 43 glycosylhydrolase [Draconibacterium sp. IB214405]|uniref:family 43 glycosylhydrolase n=1 Tax=Draconibacterium sp. IB214405 TaxID=3097352 RepID=UPI002A10A640|nr:family 43 glycosylhydrolase [Draconibacterium sp. IB214405]MDX8339376.1 family 43 glycosylhydrolase [Draconibacterium sp. IB214405]